VPRRRNPEWDRIADLQPGQRTSITVDDQDGTTTRNKLLCALRRRGVTAATVVVGRTVHITIKEKKQ
jgi:hypothetical protein